MKLIIIVLITIFSSCQTESKNNFYKNHNTMVNDSIIRPYNVSSEAQLVNLGFSDAPVYVWIEYIGYYENEEVSYPYIYGIKQVYAGQNHIDTAYYEYKDGRDNLEIPDKMENYSILPYPGDVTYKLSFKDHEFLLFNVLGIKIISNGQEWIRTPTVIHNKKNELVSDYEVDISIKEMNKDTFLVSLVNSKGIRDIKFKKFGNCLINTQVSYFNKDEGIIFFISEDCYLKIIDKSILSHL